MVSGRVSIFASHFFSNIWMLILNSHITNEQTLKISIWSVVIPSAVFCFMVLHANGCGLFLTDNMVLFSIGKNVTSLYSTMDTVCQYS